MSAEAAEKALLTGTFTPTGDRITDLILSAFAGVAVSDYDNEIPALSMETAWCHAILSNTALPTLSISGLHGYDLTHAIFYATDFGRQPISNQEAATSVINELAITEVDDLKIELGLCLLALNMSCPQEVRDLALLHKDEDSHTGIVANILLGR